MPCLVWFVAPRRGVKRSATAHVHSMTMRCSVRGDEPRRGVKRSATAHVHSVTMRCSVRGDEPRRGVKRSATAHVHSVTMVQRSWRRAATRRQALGAHAVCDEAASPKEHRCAQRYVRVARPDNPRTAR
jgi:hypothetical protein